MSGWKAFQHNANAFSKFTWFSHTTVILRGSGAVSRSTSQICFSGLGSSFQCKVIHIMNTEAQSSSISGKSPIPHELYVSISHVRISVQSLVSAEIGKRSHNVLRSSTDRKFFTET